MRKLTLAQAKAQFKNRYTLEHIPAWARTQCGNGKYYAPGYATDLEWYNNTEFFGEGQAATTRNECYSSNHTFPMGTWLDEPL